MKVYLLTTGDGSDGDEWGVESIHSTRELAEIAKKKYQKPIREFTEREYIRDCQIEEWEVDPKE